MIAHDLSPHTPFQKTGDEADDFSGGRASVDQVADLDDMEVVGPIDLGSEPHSELSQEMDERSEMTTDVSDHSDTGWASHTPSLSPIPPRLRAPRHLTAAQQPGARLLGPRQVVIGEGKRARTILSTLASASDGLFRRQPRARVKESPPSARRT